MVGPLEKFMWGGGWWPVGIWCLSLSSPRKKDKEKVSREASRDGESIRRDGERQERRRREGRERRRRERGEGDRGEREIIEERDCDNKFSAPIGA